ncbi:helix-turn-helix transcriptional regulator [Actinoplanes sp. NPDC051411]|uniref:helix-turn-helix transcriptional regulator n=1 Tax=Actinoplanes sp. NPDC051411 TaxID=3155522 RepID=UPI003431CC2A
MASKRSLLIRRREELGLSQERLAALIISDRTTVGRIERGETTPQPQTRERLSKALQVDPEQLTELLIHDGEHRPAAPARATTGGVVDDPHTTGVTDMYRRELLRLLGTAGALILLPPGVETDERANAQHPGDPNHLKAFNSHLWQVFGLSTTKRLLYPLVLDQLRVLVGRIETATSDGEHQQLCTLASELFQLAGEICFDNDQYADAVHCYNLAASAAKEGRANDQWACALTRHGYVSMYDQQHRQARAILDAAARVAARGDSQLATRQWVAVVQAQAAAALRDADGCQRALDTAQEVTGLRTSASPGGWLRFDGSRLDEERGTCYLALDQPELAAGALTTALKRTTSVRRRGSLLTDLAAIGVRRHDPDEILVHGHAAINLAVQSNSLGYVGRKLRALQTRLTPFNSDPRIAALDDRIAGVFPAAYTAHEPESR